MLGKNEMAKSCLQLQPVADAWGTWEKQGKDRLVLQTSLLLAARRLRIS